MLRCRRHTARGARPRIVLLSPTGPLLADPLADELRRRAARRAALRPLRGLRRPRPPSTWPTTRSRSAATSSPAASCRRWSSPTSSCASSPAPSATRTGPPRSLRRGARGDARVPALHPPGEYRGWDVPEVLLSGDHGKVREWRLEQSRVRAAEHERLCDSAASASSYHSATARFPLRGPAVFFRERLL